MASTTGSRTSPDGLRFLAGFAAAVVGGGAILVSAFAGGAVLTIFGLVAAAVGFLLIGLGLGRPEATGPAARRRGEPELRPAAGPGPTPPAQATAPEGDPGARVPELPLADAPPVAPPPVDGPAPTVPIVPAPVAIALPPIPEPPEVPVRPPVAVGAAAALPATEPPVSPPAVPVGGEEAEPPGEVMPSAAARSLAMLGLPAEESSPPPGPAPSLDAPVREMGEGPVPSDPSDPADRTGPQSIVFAARAVGDPPELQITPPEQPPGPSWMVSRAARSGGYRLRGAPPQELSTLWLVPGLSVLDLPQRPREIVDGRGLVTRVPAPPARELRRPRACSACGAPATAGATGENRCWGCGRPVCSDCFWRYGPGPSLHRCPSCVGRGIPSPAISGGRIGVRPSGPFGTADETELAEGL